MSATSAETPSDNVVIIHVDDLGWRDLGCMGSPVYETPHIDALAESGTLFTNAYAAGSLCTLSRACMLTGSQPSRHGVYTVVKNRGTKEQWDHAHESPKNMTYPLIVLAILAIAAGWVGFPGWLGKPSFASFVYHGEEYFPHFNWILAIIATAVGVSGIYLAYLMYYKKSISADAMAERFKGLYKLLYNKYYFDEIYQKVILDPIMAFASFMWKFDANVVDGAVNGTGWLTVKWSDIKEWFDTWIVDGAVNGTGWVVRQGANILRFIQTGSMQFYTLFILTLAVTFAVYKFDLAFLTADVPMVTIGYILGVLLLLVVTKLLAGRYQADRETTEGEE